MITYKGLSTLEILEGAKNYNKWIAKQFLPYIKSPLLEIGSGTGNMSAFFSHMRDVTLSDIDAGLVKKLQEKFAKKPSLTIRQLDIAGRITKKDIYQTIVATNVLEHIKQDQKALQHIYSMLKKNGKLLLLVPAKRIAFTRLDKSLGHFRRYEKGELEGKLQHAGFTIEKMYFFNIVGLFSWIIRDKIDQTHNFKPYQIILFDKIVPVLQLAEGLIKPFVGVSLIAVATKR